MSPFKSINKKLLPMKVVMFGWFGASACALPYMTIHMKELGLTVEETAVVYTLLPITQFLSSPIAGFIADRLGKYRDVLLLSLVMTIILATALLYVPPVDEIAYKDYAVVTSFCGDNYNILINQCDFDPSHKNQSFLHLKSCQSYQCGKSFVSNGSWDMILKATRISHFGSCKFNASVIQPNHDFVSSMCDSQLDELNLSKCSIKCLIGNTTFILSTTTRGNRQLTFFLYSALRIIYNIFSAIGFTLVNSCAIALTETVEDSGEYGRQRLWGLLAMAIFSPLAGIFVDLNSTVDAMNYAPAFHTHNALALLTCIAVWYLDFEMEDAPSSYTETFQNFWKIVKNPSIVFLLLTVFWLGTVWGFLESFLFWFMIELESPTYLMGLTVTVGSIVGLPFLYYARYIVTKIGHANLLSIAVFMYMIRLVGCSFLKDPWWVMPFEILEIFTYHLMWVSAATYAAQLSPPGLLATIQGFIEGVHYGVGQGSGSLIGGSLISVWGNRIAFQIMGVISGIIALLYSSLHFFWLRNTKVKPHSRRASVKSYSSQKTGRNNSSLSQIDINGTSPTFARCISIQETPA